jgi:3-methyladenine DNA glycosylase AlkD
MKKAVSKGRSETRSAAKTTDDRVREALTALEGQGTKRTRDGMARYGIVAPKAFGVPMAAIQLLAKRLGRDHDLAVALWDTGWYEARLLTAYVGEPDRVTPALMDRWARDFGNWAVVDTLCFSLYDRTPHAWAKIDQWSRRSDELVKRAAFALLACVALHDKESPDAPFLRSLSLIERAAPDDRNLVKKGVSWALRAVGRRSQTLNAAAIETARRLTKAPESAARWVGKDALRELTKPAVQRKLAKPRGRTSTASPGSSVSRKAGNSGQL